MKFIWGNYEANKTYFELPLKASNTPFAGSIRECTVADNIRYVGTVYIYEYEGQKIDPRFSCKIDADIYDNMHEEANGDRDYVVTTNIEFASIEDAMQWVEAQLLLLTLNNPFKNITIYSVISKDEVIASFKVPVLEDKEVAQYAIHYAQNHDADCVYAITSQKFLDGASWELRRDKIWDVSEDLSNKRVKDDINELSTM